MNFFDRENIDEVRLRSFFQNVEANTIIQSSGSLEITITNIGNMPANLIDGSGNKLLMPVAVKNDPVPVILKGHPGLVRDDILKIEFLSALGDTPFLQIRYDRFVKKGDTFTFPGSK